MRNHKTFTVFVLAVAAVFMAASTNTYALPVEHLSAEEQMLRVQEQFIIEGDMMLLKEYVGARQIFDEETGRALGLSQSLYAPATANNPATVDLLVVFDPEAINWLSSRGETMEDWALAGVQDANDTYFGSQAWTHIRLVGIEEFDLPDGLLSAFLNSQAFNGDMPKLDALRFEYRADLVMMVRNEGSNVAFRPTVPNEPRLGFSHCTVQAGVTTRSHELSHNMGMDHGDPDAPSRSIDPEPNARAYIECGTREVPGVRTRMHQGYNPECPPDKPIAPTVSAYSNANLRWKGLSDGGNPFFVERPLGDGLHNNVEVSNRLASGIADYSNNLGSSGGQEVNKVISNGCSTGPEHQCLVNDRFRLSGTWNLLNGTVGEAQIIEYADSPGRGTILAWFFNPANLEMVAKVLDGCPVNGYFWVFAGGLTNVRTFLRVEDTETGQVKIYQNPQSTAFQPIQDTQAFPCN